MDGTTFSWVLTFLAHNRINNKTEDYDIIYATLVSFFINFIYIWGEIRL
jgi:hypothetical protein